MDPSSCPFCHLEVPSSELEWHANSHFEVEDEDEQLARDLELAQQLALAPSSPPSSSMNSQAISDLPISRCDAQISMEEKVSCLIALQTRTTFYEIEHGLMALMKDCLESERGNTTSIVSGYIDHFQSIPSEDVGWGCGWRNIQMLSSHLLMQRHEAREVLFGGSGFVPDIPSLQRWLEIAWEKGFDELGSDHFANNIYGSKKWIGTTECAALFRSFGLRARVVDFGPKELESFYPLLPGSSLGKEVKRIHNGGKRKAIQVCGPMDGYLLARNHDVSQASSSGDEKSGCSSILLVTRCVAKVMRIWEISLQGIARVIRFSLIGSGTTFLIKILPNLAIVRLLSVTKQNSRSGKVAETEGRMAEVHQKRGSHTEKATVPGGSGVTQDNRKCFSGVLEEPVEHLRSGFQFF
ncbi:hypothetical protein GBA52_005806 [Prunus armeniaca]|nr:hypothetical protein GBA52_005806 [Prunus armeniaca]